MGVMRASLGWLAFAAACAAGCDGGSGASDAATDRGSAVLDVGGEDLPDVETEDRVDAGAAMDLGRDAAGQDVAADAADATLDGADASLDASEDAAADAGDVDAAPDASDAGAAGDVGEDVEIRNGCPSLRAPVDGPDASVMGDTWSDFARGFFMTWCVRCHSSTLTTPEARSGAPPGYNWDDEAAVRMRLPLIRAAVGVDNWMPLTPPNPDCDERRRLVRWIDIGAP